MKQDLAEAAVKAAPPVLVTGSSAIFDLTINDMVGIATLLYITLQVVILIRNELIRGRK